MYLGFLYYCNLEKVIYITTREDYAPYYKDDIKVYQRWSELNNE